MNHYSDTRLDSELGQVLIKDNVITKETLAEAMKQSRASERSLGEILSSVYGVDESLVYDALTKGSGISYEDIRKHSIEKSLISKISVKIATHYHFMPLRMEKDKLVIAVDYPFNIKTIDEIRLQTGLGILQVLSRRNDIEETIKKYYGFAADTVERIVSTSSFEEAKPDGEAATIESIDKLAGDASVINLVNEVIFDAFQKRATDIHLEPYRGEFRLRYRIDGMLKDTNLSQKAKHLIFPILSRIKIMANLNIVERRLPQDGRAIVMVKDQNLDLRVSSIPTAHGESVVIRILPTQMIFDLKKLGLTDKNVETLTALIKKPNGIILLTGPTGSGKTTTLYACLNKLNSNQTKIITIEDPVEYEIPGITQIQVSPKIGLDFARGLRSMLRHDPDIMMVGEIRDFETAEISIRAALTGHLVFSTLHTNDAASGVARLLDIGVEPFLVGSSVEAIIAQRLVRLICPHCKMEDLTQPSAIKQKIMRDLKLKALTDVKIYKGKGCEQCSQTGFYGRSAIHEILVLTDPVRQLVTKKASSQDIKAKAMTEGMLTLLQDGWQKVLAGFTTPSEVMNAADMDPVAPVEDGAGMEESPAPAARNTFSSPPPEEKTGRDRRIYERAETQLEVSYREIEVIYRVIEIGGSRTLLDESEHVAYTENVSASGMLLKIRELFPLGTILELKFKMLRHGKRTIQCLARAVRIEESLEPSSYYMGAMFLDLSTSDRAYLDEYVTKFNKTNTTS